MESDSLQRLSLEESKQQEVSMTQAALVILERFGYVIDENYTLVNPENGSGFQWVDQNHYDALGDLIAEHIVEEIQIKYGMRPVQIPTLNLQATVYTSPDFESNSDKWLLLICGSGYIIAGQWARSVCINESIYAGSMYPYIESALQQGYSVAIANPNFARIGQQETEKIAKGTDTAHVKSFWTNVVSRSPARKVYIVAHSRGGANTVQLLESPPSDFMQRVKAIAFTDSVHKTTRHLTGQTTQWLGKSSCNFVKSDKPLGTLISTSARSKDGTTWVSAGHPRHEMTSTCAFPAIFPFFDSMTKRIHPYEPKSTTGITPTRGKPLPRGKKVTRRGNKK